MSDPGAAVPAEARRASGAVLERLTTLVASSDSPDELCKAIFAAVDAFAAGVPQYDDQTLLIVRSKT